MSVIEIMVSSACIIALIGYIAWKISSVKDKKWDRNGIITMRTKDLQMAILKASEEE